MPIPRTKKLSEQSVISLYDCVKNYLQTEIITEYECINCNSNIENNKKLRSDASRKHSISRLPNILCFHLTRNVTDYISQLTKITDFVEFPLIANFIEYFSPGGEMKLKNDVHNDLNSSYSLKAVVEHKGPLTFGNF